MPIVTKNYDLETPNNSGDKVLNTYLDLALELSELYGKNIRQGNTFVLKGVSCSLRPKDDGLLDDYDVGMAATIRHSFCPTNKVTRKSWNLIFQQWKKQKLLAGKVGAYMRNDDFEIGYDASSTFSSARTSTIHAGGLGDTDSEKVTIFGDASQGGYFPLRDFYDSQLDPVTNLVSTDPFTSVGIKGNKYQSTSFPKEMEFYTQASSSAIVTEVNGNTMFSGGIALGTWEEFPVPISVFAGLMKVQAWVNPPDTASQVEDDTVLSISYHIARWKPLVYRPKVKRMTYKKGQSKFTPKSSRRRSRRRRR